MTDFLQRLSEDDIRFRDKFQVELKLEYSPISSTNQNIYSQEFYFFIPGALQVDPGSYSREQFYQDHTCLIRFKTPNFSLPELSGMDNHYTPAQRVNKLLENVDLSEKELWRAIMIELKLFANIIRSQVRNTTRKFVKKIEKSTEKEWTELDKALEIFCFDIAKARSCLEDTLNVCRERFTEHHYIKHLNYIEEFSSIVSEVYLTGLLVEMRVKKQFPHADLLVGQSIKREQDLRNRKKYHSPLALDEQGKREYHTYRKGILKKYVMDVLLLKTERKIRANTLGPWIGGLAAGIAMLFYMILFVWGSTWLVFNSTPFIVATVALYVLKDRIKESIKTSFFQKSAQWLPDYLTRIYTPDNFQPIGSLAESFTWIPEGSVPEDVKKMRTSTFHTELDAAERIEHTFCYKMEVRLNTEELLKRKRRRTIHNIFRFNIEHILFKASDAYQTYAHYLPENDSLELVSYPKVYHINIVMKNVYQDENNKKIVELKKFRLVVDKEGIKRVEQVV